MTTPPVLKIEIPNADDGLPEGMIPLPEPKNREKARVASTQFNWEGRPLRWTVGRLALWQALVATDDVLVPAQSYREAQAFLFLALHEDSVWERSTPVEQDGKVVGVLPPLVNSFERFRERIRQWGDEEFPPQGAFDRLRQAQDLLAEVFAVHQSARAVVIPSEDTPAEPGN